MYIHQSYFSRMYILVPSIFLYDIASRIFTIVPLPFKFVLVVPNTVLKRTKKNSASFLFLNMQEFFKCT